MSDYIATAIEEIDGKIGILTTLRDSLVQFRQEWPHTAAAMTRSRTPDGKAARRKRTDGRTEQNVIQRRAVRSLPDDATRAFGDRIVAALRAKSPQRPGALAASAAGALAAARS
jgi:hypothetical protein